MTTLNTMEVGESIINKVGFNKAIRDNPETSKTKNSFVDLMSSAVESNTNRNVNAQASPVIPVTQKTTKQTFIKAKVKETEKNENIEKIKIPTFQKYTRKYIIMKDLLHNYMEIPLIVLSIINTPIFQRLREIKQLGICSYVYPSAEHSRFVHSIGTSQLARLMMLTLQKKQPEINITDREVELVTIAGLCHDLGHGPYSHTFEIWLHRKDIPFHHEDMSIKLVRLLVSKYNISLNEEEVEIICHMIEGLVYDPDREFMYQIVNDKKASIDVDKFDYLTRDCKMTNKECSFNAEQLIQNCRVINGKLCYDKKELHTINGLFMTRYNMFQQIYLHKTVKAIEFMFMDAFEHVGKTIDFQKYLNDPNEYIKLTDNFIKSWVDVGLILNQNNLHLLAAKQIFTNIQLRKIYKNVIYQRWIFHGNQKEILTQEKIRDEIISRSANQLNENDIRVEILTLNYGMSHENPVNNVRFYDKMNYDAYYEENYNHDGVMVPKICIEHYIRIYMTNPDNLPKKKILIDTFFEFAVLHGQIVSIYSKY